MVDGDGASMLPMTPAMLNKTYPSKPASLSSPLPPLSPSFPVLSISFDHLAHSSPSTLELALGQVTNHLPTRDIRRPPKRGEIKRAAQSIGKSKEHHGRDPATGILERKATLGHLVLLGDATDQVVNAALRVDLGLILTRYVGGLGARQDVEVVVGRVAACVSLGTNGSAEDDEVLSDT